MARKKGKDIWHFSGNNVDLIDSGLDTKYTIIHEHDFKQTNIIETTTCCAIQCITCKKCFCESCGKVLNNYHDFKYHICRVKLK